MPYKDRLKRNEWARDWLSQRRARYFENKSCIKCGSTDNLELDHIYPETKVSHRIWSWSDKKREAEIIKCQVLCSECHKEKTRLYRKAKRQHGNTLYGYGCRCQICFQAKQRQNARRKYNAEVVQQQNSSLPMSR